MFSDPEWASTEEWDAYAWFGFAVSEAQALEQYLLIIATAVASASDSGGDAWPNLYDKFGRLTLGQLLGQIRRRRQLAPELESRLKEAVRRRNALAHEFFRATDPPTVSLATSRLTDDASFFRNIQPSVEALMNSVLDELHANRTETASKLSQDLKPQDSGSR